MPQAGKEIKMRRVALGVCLLLWTASFLMAGEFAIRQADYLYFNHLSFQTAEGDWLVFFSDHSRLSESIYCHKISSTGVPLTTEAMCLSYLEDRDQSLFDVIPSSDGNFFVLWKEYYSYDGYHMYVQKVNPEGQSLWASEGIKLNDFSPDTALYGMTANDAGGLTVLSQAERGGGPIYAQSYDSGGNKLWGEAELVLFDLEGTFRLEGVLAHPEGGFLVHILIMDEDYNYIRKMLRYTEAGVLVEDFCPALADLFGRIPRVKAIGPVNGEYILYVTGGYNLIINKLDANGELMYDQNILCPSSDFHFMDLKFLSDGRVAYMHTGISSSVMEIHMLSPTLEQLWSIEERLAISSNYGKIYEYPDGKIMVSWDREAQLYDASDVAQFDTPRMITNDDIDRMLTLAASDRAIFLWRCIDSTQQRIKLQAMNMDGSLVHDPAGIVLEDRLDCGIPGVAVNHHHCMLLGDRFVSIWKDARQNGSLYYQIYNQYMQPLLEPNGRAVRRLSRDSYLRQAVVSNDNKLYLFYSNGWGNLRKAYLQAIDYHGDLCFGDDGIEIVERKQMMGCVDDTIYLFWVQAPGHGQPNMIMGQKFVNGIAQWGENGKLIWTGNPNFYLTLMGFQNGLLIYKEWETSSTSDRLTFLRASVFDSDGLINTVGEYGSILLSSETFCEDDPLIISGSAVMGDDLYLVIRLSYADFNHSNILQKIDPQGNRLWGEAGIRFNEGRIITVAKVGDCLGLLTQNNYDDYKYHSVDAMGNLLTPEGGISIIPARYSDGDISFAAFEDGTAIYAFGHAGDIYTLRMNADGTLIDSSPVLLCDARCYQHSPIIAIYENTAFIIWKDERAGSRVTGLWGKAAHSNTWTPPIRQAKIVGNYPNPFNPTTTISYQIATDSMAKLDIYNIKGQFVKTLVNEPKVMGEHQAVWDGKDFRGKGVASGVFFVRLSSAGKSSVHKMLLMK